MAEQKSGLKMTGEMLERFLESMLQKGRSQSSMETYRRILMKFYRDLPEGKRIVDDTVSQWQEHLLEQGYAIRTINAHISIVNTFLQFIGKREWQHTASLMRKQETQPELTRTEYLRLLQTAKEMGRERTYLIIKTLCCVGIRSQELGQVTVEAVEKGQTALSFYGGNQRTVTFPKNLRTELLEYAGREGIGAGPVFVTRKGMPLNRSNIWHDIQEVCRKAQVAEEKANPRCLWRLYRRTYETIQADISALIEQTYEQMLDHEELAIGWNV